MAGPADRLIAFICYNLRQYILIETHMRGDLDGQSMNLLGQVTPLLPSFLLFGVLAAVAHRSEQAGPCQGWSASCCSSDRPRGLFVLDTDFRHLWPSLPACFGSGQLPPWPESGPLPPFAQVGAPPLPHLVAHPCLGIRRLSPRWEEEGKPRMIQFRLQPASNTMGHYLSAYSAVRWCSIGHFCKSFILPHKRQRQSGTRRHDGSAPHDISIQPVRCSLLLPRAEDDSQQRGFASHSSIQPAQIKAPSQHAALSPDLIFKFGGHQLTDLTRSKSS